MSRDIPLPRPGRGATRARMAEMLRVDHAGETAAVEIYKAQSRVFSRSPQHQDFAADLSRMQAEEAVHLAAFDDLLNSHRVRPTLMLPLWRVMAYGLGVGTALMGEKAAHACTEAVESVIGAHYDDQAREVDASAIGDQAPDLADRFRQFRDEELAHHDDAIARGAREAPAYPLLTAVIRAGCRAAIRISEKV
ncbi:MAG: demethoxyubiquinone hydroxylase family protein [Brevundimonas sp.]|jgi:3-demethoxyubiquinol 3-hydroxylase|uniref:demethoxyubiquinone hydroxylase family protein n=1 Tax=Brevundimonas sp. TaxID=1871086 RepID=UPI00391AC357